MILMCCLILAVHSIFQPYKKKRVNVVETLYLFALCVMATMQDFNDQDTANVICLVLLILTTVHFVAVIIYKAIGFYRSRSKRHCPKRFAKRRGYGSIAGTDFETSIGPEQIRRKNIFDIIFSNSDDSSDSFGKWVKLNKKNQRIVGDDLAVGDSTVWKTPNLRQARVTKIRTKRLKKGEFW